MTPPPNQKAGKLTCGSCRLYGANFYSFPANQIGGAGNTCCADVVMDLPASFIPNRQTMEPDDGEGCIVWEAVTEPAGRTALETQGEEKKP
jgi:hypothetical protein